MHNLILKKDFSLSLLIIPFFRLNQNLIENILNINLKYIKGAIANGFFYPLMRQFLIKIENKYFNLFKITKNNLILKTPKGVFLFNFIFLSLTHIGSATYFIVFLIILIIYLGTNYPGVSIVKKIRI